MLNRGVFIFPGRGTRSYISAAHTERDIEVTADAAIEFLTKYREDLR
jgi:glutamate-1-semialdehyde aminotransferase